MTELISIGLIILGQFNPVKNIRCSKDMVQSQVSAVKHHPTRDKKRFNFRNPESIFDIGRKGKSNRHLNRFQLEEFPFDTSSFLGTAPGHQEFPDIGFDGTNFFVVWHDNRKGEVYQVYGARITPDGVLLDSFSIPISAGEGDRVCPAVGFDGTNYFVVWMDDRDSDWQFEIYGARVTTTGMVLDPQGIPISTGTGDRWFPAIAFDGMNYFVAWVDGRNGNYDIYGTRVTPQGQVLEPQGIPICTDPYQQIIFQSIIFGDSNYYLIWMDGRDENDEYPNLYGARVRTDGVVLDTNGRPIIQQPNNQEFPGLGFDGTNYFVVWDDDREIEMDFRVYGCRIRPDGVVLDTSGILLCDYYSQYPAIDFDGTNYLLSYLSYEGIYGMRVRPDGVVIDTGGFIVNYNYSYYPPSVIFGQNISFLSFSIPGITDSDLYGARVTTDARVLDPKGIILAFGRRSIVQQYPVSAFDGSNYLIVWEDYRNSIFNTNIYGTRMTPGGQILDPEGIRISPIESWQSSPAIGCDSSNYFVVWSDDRNAEGDIFGCRLTPEGVVLDSTGIQLSATGPDDYTPSIAFDGTNYLVVWQSNDRAGGKYKICGARITPDGQILGGLEITSNEMGVYPPDVTFGGQNYLVVWTDYRNERADIYAARVSRDGEVLDPAGIPIDTSIDYDKQGPAVSFDGTNYFVVYSRTTPDWSYDIYGKRVNQAGNVLEPPIPISTAEDDQYSPSLDFDGTKYLIVWQDFRTMELDIYGARILPSGILLDTNGIPFITQPEGRFCPMVCCGPRTPQIQHLLTFSGYYSPLSTNKALGAFYLEPVGIEEKNPKATASLFQIYPNPIREKGYLQFFIPADDEVKIALYSADGRVVKTIFTGKIKAGNHLSPIETRHLPSGIYFIKLKAKGKDSQVKILILKD